MRLLIITAAVIAALGSPLTVCSQHYYVVVGAFAVNEDASEFRSYVPLQLADTIQQVSEQKNLLHLYLLKAPDKEAAIAKTLGLKTEVESGRNAGTSGPITLGDQGGASSASASASIGGAGDIPPKPVGKYFKFRIESPDGSPLPARVHHVDFENERELGTYNTNTFVDLLRPGQTNEPMALVCGIFGYKEVYKYIDYSDPSRTDRDAYVDEQGAWVIPYKLERLEKGDVSTMYNVSFYKDAAIMRQGSKVDLDELVKMMHSNPYYEITIHTHCNGKKKREIIAPGADKNYFDAAGSIKVNGSARDLTRLRAEAIRSYLADNGINPERAKIFSWGGSDMLVKADSPEAAINDRVEIEIMRD